MQPFRTKMKVKRQKLLYNFDFERSDATLFPARNEGHTLKTG